MGIMFDVKTGFINIIIAHIFTPCHQIRYSNTC